MTILLQHGVTGQAEANPDAVALVCRGSRVTYRELEVESNRVAHELIEMGCKPDDRVAIFMPKMPAAIVAMLGILKAECAYVPLDPTEHAPRLARMLEIADCGCLLAAGPVSPKLRQVLATAKLARPPAIGWLDRESAAENRRHVDLTRSALLTMPIAPAQRRGMGDRLAQLLFTSDSNGTTRGVMISHANILHFIRWATAYFDIRKSDRISQHPPLQFDRSAFDVFGALWAGAELHLVPEEMNAVPHRLGDLVRDSRLTQWQPLPSVLNLLARFDVMRNGDFPQLRRVLFAGAALPAATLAYWMRRLPHVQFTSLYGPTETTIASSYYTVPHYPDRDDECLPLGSACDGEELLLLDSNMRPVVDGYTEGDLYIRGRGVSPGYWGDPEQSRAAFFPYAGRAGDRIYRTGDRAFRDARGLLHRGSRLHSPVTAQPTQGTPRSRPAYH